MGTHRLAAMYNTAKLLICKTFFLEINFWCILHCMYFGAGNEIDRAGAPARDHLVASVFLISAVPIFFRNIGAGNEIRTRDPNLGKVVLYQLSYSRT